jgi:hypothetical protein
MEQLNHIDCAVCLIIRRFEFVAILFFLFFTHFFLELNILFGFDIPNHEAFIVWYLGTFTSFDMVWCIHSLINEVLTSGIGGGIVE